MANYTVVTSYHFRYICLINYEPIRNIVPVISIGNISEIFADTKKKADTDTSVHLHLQLNHKFLCLVHCTVIFYSVKFCFNYFHYLNIISVALVLTTIFAFVVAMLVEFPFIQLLKLLQRDTRRYEAAPPKDENDDQNPLISSS